MKTRSQIVRAGLMAAIILGITLPALGAFAATKAKPAKKAKVADVTVVGTIAVEKNKKGKVVGITLTDGEGTAHPVMMNASAKKMAKELEGKSVEVVARKIEKKSKAGAKVFLMVKKFKAAAEAPAPPAKPEEGGGGGGDE